MAEEKTENDKQYKEYLAATEGIRKELGIQLKEEMYGAAK